MIFPPRKQTRAAVKPGENVTKHPQAMEKRRECASLGVIGIIISIITSPRLSSKDPRGGGRVRGEGKMVLWTDAQVGHIVAQATEL